MKKDKCTEIAKCTCAGHTHRGLGQFLSSYIEAVGNNQEVQTDEDIVFDISEDYIDNVGNNFTISDDGKTITINTLGLYHVEWSLNIEGYQEPVLIGLLENGEPSSAIYSGLLEGNVSSGALINVTSVPYTISLHNFGEPISLVNPAQAENTSASIRILRFASGSTN